MQDCFLDTGRYNDHHGNVYPCGGDGEYSGGDGVCNGVDIGDGVGCVLTEFRETHSDIRAVCVSLELWCVIWSCEDNSG